MTRVLLLTVLLLAPGTAGAAMATQDWPCIQPRQPHLSVGQMWSGPLPEGAGSAANRDTADLAARLAQRRLPLSEAGGLIDAYAAAGTDPERLGGLFAVTLTRIDAERTAIMDGIARYGRGQGDLAARIAAGEARLVALNAAQKPDFDVIDAQEATLDWDRRIFDERRQMLTAVCDSPVLLEQRAFELARLIAARLPPPAP